jgi:hypothetical protein
MEGRKSNHHTGSFIPFSETLFTDCIIISGVRVAEVKDGTGRYVSTWLKEDGRPHLSVSGYYSMAGVMHRYAKRSTTTPQETN